MAQNNLENAGRYIGDADTVLRALGGKKLITGINKNRLPVFIAAGLESGFKVEVIAEAGEDFYAEQSTGVALPFLMQGKDNVAVSIEELEGGKKGHIVFWNNLMRLEGGKVMHSSELTSKP